MEPHHYSRSFVRNVFPDAEIVLSGGGTMYMVRAGDRLLSGPKATIAKAWIEAAKVTRETTKYQEKS